MYVNNSLKSLLLAFLISSWCLAMEKVAPVPGESQERAIVPFPEGLYQSASNDVKKLLLQYILALETSSSVFPKVGELRGVSRQWQEFLHDAVLLKKIFQRCQYPETVRENPAVLGCLGSYVGSLVAKTERTPFERDFIDLLRLNPWDFNDLLSSLVTGPHCTTASLRKANADLLQVALVLSFRKEWLRIHNSVIDYTFIKLGPLMRDESLLLRFQNALLGLRNEVLQIFADDDTSKVLREELTRRADSDLKGLLMLSTQFAELSFTLLDKILYVYAHKPHECIALDVRELYQIIKDNCALSRQQQAFFDAVCKGKTSEFLKGAEIDGSLLSPVVVAVALLLAAKAGDTEGVRALFVATGKEHRLDLRSMSLSFRLTGQIIFKRLPQLCLEYCDYQRALVGESLEDKTFLCLKVLEPLCCFIDTVEELHLYCTVAESLNKKMEIAECAYPLPREWLQACLEQDEEKVKRGLKLFQGTIFDIMCMDIACTLVHYKKLSRTRASLQTTAFGATSSDALLNQLPPVTNNEGDDQMSLNPFTLRNFFEEVDTKDRANYLKSYWIDSFVENFAYTEQEQRLLDAIARGDNDAAIAILSVLEERRPLFVELALLSALRFENAPLAKAMLAKLLSLEGDMGVGLEYLLEWTLLYAAHLGFEEIWHALHEQLSLHFQEIELRRRYVRFLATPNLSEVGFCLVCLKLDMISQKSFSSQFRSQHPELKETDDLLFFKKLKKMIQDSAIEFLA